MVRTVTGSATVRASTVAATPAPTPSAAPATTAAPAFAPTPAQASAELDSCDSDLDRICLFNLLSACVDTIYFKDLRSRFIRVSRSQAAHTGAPDPDGMLGLTDFDYFTQTHATAAFEAEQAELEHTLVIAGTRRFLRSRLIPEAGRDGVVHHVLAVSHDLTDRKRLEDALADLAVHDPLTGLANRALLLDRLEHALRRTRGGSGRLAVVFVDLDRFKTVNDTHGHTAGDQLLVAVAARLRHAARRGDLVARFGGDEFVLLCENIRSRADATTVAQRIVQALAAPFAIDGRLLRESASIGVAVTSDGSDASDLGCSAKDLLHRADTAMYQVKARHCATSDYAFFTSDADADADNEARQGARGLSARRGD